MVRVCLLCCKGVPVLLLAEIPFMMAKFATFDAFSKLAYNVFPLAAESVAASLGISLISGMVGKWQLQRQLRQRERHSVVGAGGGGAGGSPVAL